jgi:hypothetical protein
MAVTLNKRAFNHGRTLVNAGRAVRDDRDAWSEHQPSTEEENAFIARHGFAEYGRWHLGIDPEKAEDTKQRYKFPYGDFRKIHRCAVVAAESRAGQYGYVDVEDAAAQLHSMLDPKKHRAVARMRKLPI